MDRPVTTYNDSLQTQIDARIRAALSRITARGTALERTTTGLGLSVRVLFDDADTPQWIQTVGNVEVLENDRVVCVNADGVWTVVGVLARRSASNETFRVQGFTVGGTTSGAFVDMPGSPTVGFLKRYDDSHVRVTMNLSAYADTTGQTIRFGVAFVGEAGSTDYDVSHFYFNTALEHHSMGGTAEVAQGSPAGLYSVVLRWRRPQNANQIRVDAQDWATLDMEERF